MEQQTFTIPKISCGHCVKAIKDELQHLEGVQSVEGDPSRKEITVHWNAPADADIIKDKLSEIDYPVQ